MGATWLLMLLAGCSDELHQLYPTTPDGRAPIELGATIEQVSETRADEGGFADGDRFGVFVVNYQQDLPGTLTLSDNQANNVAFTYNADANTWNSATDIYWKDNVTPIDVYGYYPFNNGMGDVESYRFEVEPDQSIAKEGEMGNYEASDLLWAKASRALPGKKVQLTFNHILSGVKVTLQQGTGFEGDTWSKLTKTITVDNTIRTASVDLSTGIATPDGNADRNVVMNPESGDTYRVVVVPQGVAAGKSIIGITIDGVTYHYNRADGMTYTAGKLHNFTIKVDRKADGGGYALSLVSEDVTDWEADKSSHDFEANSYLVVNVPVAGTLENQIKDMGVDPYSIRNIKIIGNLTNEDFIYLNSMNSLYAVNLQKTILHNELWNEEEQRYEQGNFLTGRFNESVRKIILPETLVGIGDHCFRDMTLSSTITIPESVKFIGNWAFADTKGVFTIILPDKIEKIEECAFARSSVSMDLKLPNSLKYIGFRAFAGARNIYGTFSLPSNLEYLGQESFDGCGTNLSGRIDIPINIKEIPQSAFKYLGFKLPVEVNFHDGVTRIGPGAFTGLKFSTPISFPKNLTSIGSGAFSECTFTGDLLLPESISDLGKDAFSNTNIKGSLELPASLEIFGGSDSEFYINDNGPFSNTLIESLIIGDNIEIIKENASNNCKLLKSVSIGKNTTQIGKNAFMGCPLIETIVCLAKEPPALDDSAFCNVDYSHCVVEVPESSVEAYRNASGWNKFHSITPHHELNFSLSELNCLNKGISRTLIVRAEGPWEVTECPSWIHVNPNNASYKEEITVTVDPISMGAGNREGKVVFKLKNSGYTNYITVRQYDYSVEEDKEIMLQNASGNGNSINIFIVGEGYGAEDIINGKYMDRVSETMDNLFSVEPYKTYRNMFSVSTSIALSPDNGAQDVLTSKETKFGFFFPEIDCPYVSDITRNTKEYIKNVSSSIDNNNIDKALIIVLANYDSFAGNSYQCVDDNCQIALIGKSTDFYPFDNRGLVLRYAGGMAFAGLASEEINHIETIKGCTCLGCNGLDTYKKMKSKGLFENITISGKIEDSPWKDFIFHPKYSAIVDMYEGGYNHMRGVWRSENESVMNTYIPYYNTISRYVIYKHIMQRAGLTPSLDEFIANDKIEIPE